MFTTDFLGRRTMCRPRLLWDGDNGEQGGGGGEPPKVTLDGEEFDFPANTPISGMTAEQKSEYWRHQSKKQQKLADSRKDYDQQKAKADQFDQFQQQQMSDQDKALQTAREDGRREGENLGADRYLKEAVKGHYRALTGKTAAEVDTAFAHVDARSFVKDGGELDTDAIKTFADTLGGANGETTTTRTDPVREAADRLRSGGSGGKTMSERRTERREALTKKS